MLIRKQQVMNETVGREASKWNKLQKLIYLYFNKLSPLNLQLICSMIWHFVSMSKKLIHCTVKLKHLEFLEFFIISAFFLQNK